MSDVATIVRKLTPAQIRLLRTLRPIAGERGSFSYSPRFGGDGLQSGTALFRRGLVAPHLARPRCAQVSCTRTRGFITLTEMGLRVHAEVTRAD